ncbi:A/G-specific adenine glycosylase [Nocardia sp. 004]|uniref:A/G-specific adenine glycosylase n=1 Tax=Nocardia sp. 004 TaxID=3385978 RepID=UPI0039A266B5
MRNSTAKDIDPDILLDWYRENARALPWREPGTTAWQILLSEIMLQQTPVARVEPIWREWVVRWPVPSALAASVPAEVLRAWGKLGYPRRALRLHECARVLATEHNDEVPADVQVLLGLPGIGAYTARAVACFAYGQRVPVVDTNVRRVVARAVHGRAEAGNPAARDLPETEALLPRRADRAAVFSAALMEFGATVCTARTPDCARCPLTHCAWVAAGKPATEVVRRTQKYEGTDRQARGRLLDVLRRASGPVERVRLDLAWTHDHGQRARALDSLLVDGLIEQTRDGLFALAGEGGHDAHTD